MPPLEGGRMEINMKKSIILFLSMSIIFTGCGLTAENESSETANRASASDTKSVEMDISITAYNGRDREEVEKHLEQYPTDFDELKETEVFLSTAPFSMRKEKLNEFIECVQQGETTSVDMITFTTEGDPVPSYIQYNGSNFYCYQSLIHDTYDTEDSIQFTEKKYKNMYLLDISDEDFSDLDLSEVSAGFQEFVLSNEKIDDYASFEKSEEDSFSVRISPFDSEEVAKEHIKKEEE